MGGGFHPGIELTYMMHERSFFEGAFRFRAGTIPGSIAAYMSVPWQGDFWSCNISWWPAIRPDIVIQSGTQKPPLLTPIPWFRSQTIPPNSDSISGYEGGYQAMADDWYKFGLVTPDPGKTDQGEQVYQETERDLTLDGPSLIASVSSDYAPIGSVLAESSGSVTVQEQKDGVIAQQWELLDYTASPDYFFIASKTDGNVLTAAFSGSVSLQLQKSPADDGQLWQYLPSGYPGVFFSKA